MSSRLQCRAMHSRIMESGPFLKSLLGVFLQLVGTPFEHAGRVVDSYFLAESGYDAGGIVQHVVRVNYSFSLALLDIKKKLVKIKRSEDNV